MAIVVRVDAGATVRPVPPEFFGHNTEWTNSGDGFWDAKSGQARADSGSLVHSVRPGLIRFPGGSLSNYYRWANAIGNPSLRKPGINYTSAKLVNGAWSLQNPSLTASTYGFDEHMAFVRQTGAAGALVTVNATRYPTQPEWSGSAQEAAAWVAYANARQDAPDVPIGRDYRGEDWHTRRYWAALRAANGHPTPYRVRYWEIGNEVDDASQGAGMTGTQYADRVTEYAQAMRAMDPSVQIGAVLGMGWLPDLLRRAGSQIDFFVYHFYGPGQGDTGVTLYSNGEREATVEGDGKAETLIVEAAGSPAAGVWPEMVVRVDGKNVGQFTVNADERQGHSATYRVDLSLASGPHRVGIAFTNDAMVGAEDRNLFVKRLSLASGGQMRAVPFVTPAQMQQRLAALPDKFGSGFDTVRAAIARDTPRKVNKIPVLVTEFNAMYLLSDPEARQIKDLKSALLVDALLQRALAEPLCPETNYWSLSSWWFRIVEFGPAAPFLSPSGQVYRLFNPLHQGKVVTTVVTAPVFEAAPDLPRAPKVTAVAVRSGSRLAVNLVNFSADQDGQVVLNVQGLAIHGTATVRILTGPEPDSTNEPDSPARVHIITTSVKSLGSRISFRLPAHSAATVVASR